MSREPCWRRMPAAPESRPIRSTERQRFRNGRVTVPLKDKGRFILVATQEEKGDLTLANQKVATLYHIATLTFVND